MKTITLPIPDKIPDTVVEECIKQIKDLNEAQLVLTCDSKNPRFRDKDRVLYLTYPDYFASKDIFITGTLIGAVLYKGPWIALKKP